MGIDLIWQGIGSQDGLIGYNSLQARGEIKT